MSEDSRPRVEGATRILLRPKASPLPLAFFAFGVGSGLQSAYQLGLIPQGETRNLELLFAAVVFPAMLLSWRSCRARRWGRRCSV